MNGNLVVDYSRDDHDRRMEILQLAKGDLVLARKMDDFVRGNVTMAFGFGGGSSAASCAPTPPYEALKQILDMTESSSNLPELVLLRQVIINIHEIAIKALS